MRWVLLLVGLLVGYVGGAGSIIYLQTRNTSDIGEMSIMFAPKNYYDGDQFVAVSGTLTGPDMAYPNNTYSIACYQQSKECWSTYVEAIGARQIGRMDAPSAYDIRLWTKNEIVRGTTRRSDASKPR